MTRQTDGKSLYEQQEEQILAQSDAFISLLTKRGILGDHKIDNDKIRKAQQEKNRKSYHNTQLLLQHYRNIAWLLECLPMDIAKELEEPYEDIDKLIDHMDLEVALGNRKLENRMEGIMRTRLLFDRVNEALTVLSHKPDNGKRLYDVIYHTYIRPDKLGNTEWFFKLSDIQDFDVKFVPKEYSQGLSLKKCKVIGDIVFEATVKESDTVPLAYYNGTLMFDQKVTGRFDSIASTNITVDNPPDMDRFLEYISQYVDC